VHHGSHFIGCKVNVRLTVITYDKPMSVTMTLNDAFDAFDLLGQVNGLLVGFNAGSFVDVLSTL